VDRTSYFDPDRIGLEIETALANCGDVDHVTFLGDGEPTLSEDLGQLVRHVKGSFDIPVAVITNGSLLHDPGVREDLMEADRVLPTLSTADPRVWTRMHRPHRSLDLARVMEGLVAFGEEYPGDMWLEVMLVKGLNDGDAGLLALREAIDRVGPGRVDLLVPTRPPTEPWVEVPDPASVLRAEEVLGTGDALLREPDGSFSVPDGSDVRETLVAIGSRHPLREEVAEDICARMDSAGEASRMVEEGRMARVRYRGEVFLIPQHLTGAAVYHDDDREVGR
jgi:wyosine [tRNA(Phe)-imidazoG37] synthetase (radical SAM superfamily)